MQPQVYGLDIMCGYSESTPLSAKDTVESKIKENLSETECLKDAQCEVSVNLENTMFAVSTTKITLKVALKSSNDPDIDGYISTGTSK